jgi:GNAT superfamily N-acetyltransferase
MKDDSFRVRTMSPEEVALAVDWAAAEGWNPGLTDASCFAAAAPDGFLLGELAGAPAVILSVVNYDEHFSFLGFYIVRPDLRGRGLGLRIWQAGMARAGSRAIGLDGVVAQQDNYRKSGFVFAYNNIRYGGWVAPVVEATPITVSLSEVSFDLIARDDATVFPATRPTFLNTWIAAPGHVGRALIRDRRLVAWGVIRPCRTGRKIGPFRSDPAGFIGASIRRDDVRTGIGCSLRAGMARDSTHWSVPNVGFWHKADIQLSSVNVRFRG